MQHAHNRKPVQLRLAPIPAAGSRFALIEWEATAPTYARVAANLGLPVAAVPGKDVDPASPLWPSVVFPIRKDKLAEWAAMQRQEGRRVIFACNIHGGDRHLPRAYASAGMSLKVDVFLADAPTSG
eukprot:4129699-Heterocapsa_arctica.AAC.1